MEWSNLYDESNPPTLESVKDFVNNGLWQEINSFLQDTYHVQPKLTYSKCSMQRGWNVKYQKSGRSLCTLYPMQDYFIALVVIGNKEMPEADLCMPSCSKYIQELYKKTTFSAGGRWLMIDVTGKEILDDVINLIKIRVSPQKN
jgi:hypothetical protein